MSYHKINGILEPWKWLILGIMLAFLLNVHWHVTDKVYESP